MTTPNDVPVLASIRHSTGVLELNRPKALNSLNPEMIDIIAGALERWRDDDRVTQVLITSRSPKAFCAGGDVRHARELIVEGEHAPVDEFFRREYAMNNLIGTYPKPYIAVMDGIVMGGGLGVSAHGSHRVITERAWASMPEMAIGYVTDVGISWSSQHAWPDSSPAIGAFIGLTGYRLTAADMLYLGLATHFVNNPDAFAEAVVEVGIDAALAKHAVAHKGESALAHMVPDIDATFGEGSWMLIDAALNNHPNHDYVEVVRGLMAKASPSAVVATAELFDVNRTAPSLREGLDNEQTLGEVIRREPDFVEGVRAVLVDKTQDAQFTPAHSAESYRKWLS